MFQRLLGELGPPPHPGVSESLSVFVFCCFFVFSICFAFLVPDRVYEVYDRQSCNKLCLTSFWCAAAQNLVKTDV